MKRSLVVITLALCTLAACGKKAEVVTPTPAPLAETAPAAVSPAAAADAQSPTAGLKAPDVVLPAPVTPAGEQKTSN